MPINYLALRKMYEGVEQQKLDLITEEFLNELSDDKVDDIFRFYVVCGYENKFTPEFLRGISLSEDLITKLSTKKLVLLLLSGAQNEEIIRKTLVFRGDATFFEQAIMYRYSIKDADLLQYKVCSEVMGVSERLEAYSVIAKGGYDAFNDVNIMEIEASFITFVEGLIDKGYNLKEVVDVSLSYLQLPYNENHDYIVKILIDPNSFRHNTNGEKVQGCLDHEYTVAAVEKFIEENIAKQTVPEVIDYLATRPDLVTLLKQFNMVFISDPKGSHLSTYWSRYIKGDLERTLTVHSCIMDGRIKHVAFALCHFPASKMVRDEIINAWIAKGLKKYLDAYLIPILNGTIDVNLDNARRLDNEHIDSYTSQENNAPIKTI